MVQRHAISIFIFHEGNGSHALEARGLNQVAQQYWVDTAQYHPKLMSIDNSDLYRPVSFDTDQFWIHNFKMCEKIDALAHFFFFFFEK